MVANDLYFSADFVYKLARELLLFKVSEREDIMKTILSILLLVILFQGLALALDLLPVMSPVTPSETYLINTILENGPAHLQNVIIEEKSLNRSNLLEELEQKLIEVRLLQQSV